MKSIKLGEFSLKKVLEMLIEATYLSIFFAVPLAMAFFLKTDNVFELNKIILFKSLIYILFSLTLVKALFFPSKQRFSLRYLIPVLALLIFGAISLFFSVDPVNSYYGLSDRQQGYRSLLFYAWWFFLLLYNLVIANDLNKKISNIFWVIMGSSFLVSLYGILQMLGIDFIAWTEPAFITHRTTSTLGQPNYFGSYLVLIIPLTISGLIRYCQPWSRFILSVILLAQILALVTTGSRSAWLGLLAALALVVFWSLYRSWPKISAPKRRGVVLSIALSIVVVALLLSQNNYISSRLQGLTDFKQGSVSARFNFWSGALESISKKPLLGYGMENQGREFIKYYQADWAKTGFVNASTNRAHNLILDILLTTGIIGLIFYAWVYTSFFRWANRIRSDKRYYLLSEAIIASVLAYLISLLFGFSVVTTEVYFWSCLAIVASISARTDGAVDGDFKIKLNNWIKALMVALVLVFSFCQISRDLKVLAADNYFLEIRQVLTQNDYPKALFYYQKIKELGVHDFNYDYYLVDSLPYDLNTAISPVIANLIQKELKDILSNLTIDDYDSYYLKAKIYTVLKNYPQAEENYQEIIRLSPNLPKNYFARAKFYVVFQKDDLALADLEKTLELLPEPENYPESLSSSEKSVAFYKSLILRELGDLYFRQQKYDLADDNYRASYLLNLNDLPTYKKIADSYFMQGDLKSAIWYNLRAWERHPNDYVWPFSLSFLYNQQGDYENANKYLDLAITLDTRKNISSEMIDSIKKKSE